MSKQPLAQQHLFDGTSGPLSFRDADAVLQGLLACLSDWPSRQTDSAAQPLACVESDGCGGYDLRSRFTEKPAKGLSVTAAVCSLIADLSLDLAESAPELLGLHAAAISTEAGIVILAGPARAGKTTLVSRLALQPGIGFVCDDVLPVRTDGQALALGIAPRLRLPLPQPEGPLAQALQRDLLLADHRYAYFNPPGRLRYGQHAPLAGFILLDRVEDEAPGLWVLSEEDAIAALLRQSITGFGTADAAFSQAEAMVQGLPRARLVYSDFEAVAAFLPVALKDLGTAQLPERLDPTAAKHAPSRPSEASLPSSDTAFAQNPLVISRVVGTRQWLTLPDDGTLWELNPTSGALWSMLEIPGDAEDLTEVLAEHFPDTLKDCILADVLQALAQLADAHMIVPV